MSFYQCENGQINTDGIGLLDIRFNEEQECAYLQTCCNVGNILDKPSIPEPKHKVGCGYRNADGIVFKITGGSEGEAEFGEFPWMTAVLKEEVIEGSSFNIFQCGGSLITPK